MAVRRDLICRGWLWPRPTSGSSFFRRRATGCATPSGASGRRVLPLATARRPRLDEAAFIILEGLSLPIDTLDPFLDARLLRRERERLDALIEARVTTRKPAAYLLNRAYIQGMPFYVDERVIVPRSFIGELLMTTFAEDNATDRRPGGGFARARPLRRRRLPRHSRRPRLSPTRPSTPPICRPTRSPWRGATSTSMGCPIA